MLLILSFLLFLPKILFGFRVAHLIWRNPSSPAMFFKFFLGILLGMGLWSLGYYLWIWAGLNRFIFPWLEVIVSLLVILPGLRALKLPVNFPQVNLRKLVSPLNLVFLLVIMVSAVLFGFVLFMNPHGHEDAWFIWNLDARFIYLARDFRVLYTPGGPGWHPDYPLMISLNVVSGWVLLGQDSTRVPMAVTSLFTLVLPGILFSGLAFLKDSKQAILASIVLLASPVIIVNGTSQQADTSVSAFVLASLALMALYFKTQETSLLFLAGLTTGLSAWAKNEGYLFILVCTILIFLFLARPGKIRHIRNYVTGLAIPLLVILFYKFSIPVVNDLLRKNDFLQLLDWSRYEFILRNLAEAILGLGQWPVLSLVAVLLVYALLVWFEYPEVMIVRFVGLAILLQLAGYFAVYVWTPHELTWHLQTSKDRLILQIFPAILFLFFYSTRSPDFNLLEVWKYATRH